MLISRPWSVIILASCRLHICCSLFIWGKGYGSGGIRTHAPEETGALNQRLRPLGHATLLFIVLAYIAIIPEGQVFQSRRNLFLIIIWNKRFGSALVSQKKLETFNQDKQCCGSGMFIPDTGSDIVHLGSELSSSRILDPGSQIPDPHQRI